MGDNDYLDVDFNHFDVRSVVFEHEEDNFHKVEIADKKGSTKEVEI